MKSAIKISTVNIDTRSKLDIRAGDTVKVSQKIKEGDKFRTQIFEGLVLGRKHGAEAGATFTVRKVTSGVGVERIFPLYSPAIEKVEVVRRAKIRRAKLYHVREKAAKEINRQMRREMDVPEVVKEEKVAEAPKEETKSEVKAK